MLLEIGVLAVGLMAGASSSLSLLWLSGHVDSDILSYLAMLSPVVVVAIGNWGLRRRIRTSYVGRSLLRLVFLQSFATFLVPFVFTTWSERTTLLAMASLLAVGPAVLLVPGATLWLVIWTRPDRRN